MNAHNALRALHEDTNPLEWNTELAIEAQEYAEELMRLNTASTTVKLIHEVHSNDMGENLYWRDNSELGTCADASLAWLVVIKTNSSCLV